MSVPRIGITLRPLAVETVRDYPTSVMIKGHSLRDSSRTLRCDESPPHFVGK